MERTDLAASLRSSFLTICELWKAGRRMTRWFSSSHLHAFLWTSSVRLRMLSLARSSALRILFLLAIRLFLSLRAGVRFLFLFFFFFLPGLGLCGLPFT